MVDARLLDPSERAAEARHQRGALDLARRLPALLVAAREVAATVMHGVHGRKRAGVGETFWQFRPFVWGESTTRIDWRRSARPGEGDAALTKHISWGPGPRAAQSLMLATRARALVDGRLAPSIDDVRALAEPILKHRMALTFSARAEGETISGVIARLAARLG